MTALRSNTYYLIAEVKGQNYVAFKGTERACYKELFNLKKRDKSPMRVVSELPKGTIDEL